MHIKITLALSVAVLAGIAVPSIASAHGNDDPNHQVQHVQRKQADQARHAAGVSRSVDRQIHKQDRRIDRQQHRLGNGYLGTGLAPYYGNNGVAQPYYGQSSGYAGSGVAPYYGNGITTQPYYGQSSINGSWGAGVGNTAANGHAYTQDGHRLDHHGNHDDGPGDN